MCSNDNTLATQSFMCKDIYNGKKWKLHEYWTVIEQLNKSWCIYALLVDDFKMLPSKNV